ncbi:MAG: enoyl-CoA hydratase-related protein [Pseudomonadota bacterium]|nr:enoyl-CoA hydratase-related protein [Pseudomonadota bacterium]
MAASSLRMVTDGRGVCTLTLSRPDCANALDGTLVGEMLAAFEGLKGDRGLRILVLTGEGATFSGGADLRRMEAMGRADAAANLQDAIALARLFESLAGFGQPTLARVNGPVYGGAIGLIAACDIAVASSDARFAFREVRLGLIPAVIAPLVVNAIGQRQARRWMLTGETFDAGTAQNLGLVHLVAPPQELDAAVEGEVRHVLAGGPASLVEAKALLGRWTASSPVSSRELAEQLAELRSSPEGREGILAFLEKRGPEWRR